MEGDEADYRSEIERLAAQSPKNNLYLNILKIKKMVMEFQRNVQVPVPLVIEEVESG